MALRISDTRMVSDLPGCTATAAYRDGAWRVTGYPGRRFTRA